MSDPKERPESVEADSDTRLDETTPPMVLQEKSADPSDFEPLDKTTAEMREFLGSQEA